MTHASDLAPTVVDTDVVSFLFKRDTRAERYRRHLSGRLLVISFMTIAELDRWALSRNWGERRLAELEQHLRRFLVHPFDRELCRAWATVIDGARRRGRPIATADAWIAATAVHHAIPLVTHNGDDYAGVEDLRIITEEEVGRR